MGKTDYGASLGKLNRDAADKLIQISGSGDFHARLHAEEMTLHGDPAIKFNFQPLPDYVVEEPQVVINPQFVSIAETTFTARIKLYNIGKAVKDSITVEVKRQYPDNSIVTLLRKKIPGILYTDSLVLTVPIIATRDKGLNKLIIKVDADEVVTEITETNNTVTKEFYIYEDEARPISPYNFAIVNTSTLKLYASTANPLSTLKQYVLEMDTSELFNSPAKISKTISSVGGLLEFDPGVSLKDSTVYYWHVSLVPASGGDYHWNESSFIYLAASSTGFNQSHYYQHLKSDVQQMYLAADRTWKYRLSNNTLFVTNAEYPTAATQDGDFLVSVNQNNIIESSCLGFSLIFNVFDPVTFKPWKNVDASGNNLYLSGSVSANCKPTRNYNIEFSFLTADARGQMMRFMDSIPAGAYVVVRSIAASYQSGNTYANDWKADTAIYGPGNSLYHRLVGAGFATLDSFYRPRAFSFVYKKGDPSFTPKYGMTDGIYDKITMSVDCPTPDTLGYITSPLFGPAKKWKQVHWRGISQEPNSADNPTVNVIGVTAPGNRNVFYTYWIKRSKILIFPVLAQHNIPI